MLREKLLLCGWELLGIRAVKEKQIVQNEWKTRAVLGEADFFRPDAYIENQAQWDGVPFGSRYTFAYGGCGVIATYNALFALRGAADQRDLEETLTSLQRHGAVWGGRYGVSVKGIERFWREKGYVTKRCVGADPNGLHGLESCSVWIATVFNVPGKLTEGLHTVCITKENNCYFIHNTYTKCKGEDGSEVYAVKKAGNSLADAVERVSAGGSAPLVTIGIDPKDPI